MKLFATIALGYALILLATWHGDALIGRIVLDNACAGHAMAMAVTYFTAILLVAFFYLIAVGRQLASAPVATLRRWPAVVHLLGGVALGFTLLTPFIVLYGPQSRDWYGERVAVTEALESSKLAQRTLAEHLRRQPPASGSSLTLPPNHSAVSELQLTADKHLRIIFHTPRYRNLDGREIILQPNWTDGEVRWDCRGGTVADAVRPAACRQRNECR